MKKDNATNDQPPWETPPANGKVNGHAYRKPPNDHAVSDLQTSWRRALMPRSRRNGTPRRRVLGAPRQRRLARDGAQPVHAACARARAAMTAGAVDATLGGVALPQSSEDLPLVPGEVVFPVCARIEGVDDQGSAGAIAKRAKRTICSFRRCSRPKCANATRMSCLKGGGVEPTPASTPF